MFSIEYDKELELSVIRQEEREESKIKIARNILSENMPISLIEKLTELPYEQIKSLTL